MITVGLLGFGFSARTLQRPLIEACGLRIVGVVTRQAEAVRTLLPDARVLPDLPALLALPQLDLIVIATPNHLHAPQALSALEHGKHVVIDKPVALSLTECDALGAAAARHDRRLSVFHNRRWDSDFLTLKRLLASDSLGTVLAFEAHWDRFRPQVPDRWRERPEYGGGVLYDLGAHLIDQALCLFGMPEWLQAEVFRERAGAVADDAFLLRLGRGRQRLQLSARSVAADAALRYRVHGLKASFSKSGLDVQERQLRAGMSPKDRDFGWEPQAQWGTLIEGDSQRSESVPAERGDWCAFYEGLRASIEQAAPVPVPLGDARRVIRIIEAARDSSDGGRRVYLNDQ